MSQDKTSGSFTSAQAPAKKVVLGNRYELSKTLGRGSYGKVQLAWDRRENQYVAVKTLYKVDSKTGKNLLSVITQEVNALRRLGGHPFVTSLTEVLVSKRRVFIVMRKASGEIMTRIADPYSGRVPERRVRYVVQQLTEVLAYAHTRGVAHRDIKPANILASDDGEVILSDFGLCALWEPQSGEKAREESTGPLAETFEMFAQTACGSPHYVSPEVVSRLPTGYDPCAADCWSLGVTMFVMLTGVLPFQGQTYRELYAAARRAVLVWPEDAKISKSAKEVVRKLLTPSVKDRWTLQDLRESPWYAGEFTDSCIGVREWLLPGHPEVYSYPPIAAAEEEHEITIDMSDVGDAILSTVPDANEARELEISSEQRAVRAVEAASSQNEVAFDHKGMFDAFEFISLSGLFNFNSPQATLHGHEHKEPFQAVPYIPGQSHGEIPIPGLADIEDVEFQRDNTSPCRIACIDCKADLRCPSSTFRHRQLHPFQYYFVDADASEVRTMVGDALRAVLRGMTADRPTGPCCVPDENQKVVSLRADAIARTLCSSTCGCGGFSISSVREEDGVLEAVVLNSVKAKTANVFSRHSLAEEGDVTERIDVAIVVREAGAMSWVEVRRMRGSALVFMQFAQRFKHSLFEVTKE